MNTIIDKELGQLCTKDEALARLNCDNTTLCRMTLGGAVRSIKQSRMYSVSDIEAMVIKRENRKKLYNYVPANPRKKTRAKA